MSRSNKSKTTKPSNNNNSKSKNSAPVDKIKAMKGKGEPGTTPDNRKDNMDGNKRGDFPNDPQWYYGDAIIADEISRFSFNQFAGITTECLRGGGDEIDLPTVMVIPLNPCPGVTPANPGPYRDNGTNQVNGINQALQQWWSVLTSRSGRGATYSKSDVGMLILALGEIISTIEHLRKVLGIAFTYNLRNRIVPGGLVTAMGIDEYDLMSQLADYRLRLNTLIMRLNKIPIPGNIEYFRKCQDLYQKLYVDSISDMAQFYVLVPATTWQINEILSQTGTVLETIDGFYHIHDDGITQERYLEFRPRLFSEWLDELEQMIAALMNSSTFSNIYSDLLNASALGAISLWSFDLVPENYSVMPEYNEMMLLMIHNLLPTGMQHVQYYNMLTHIDAGTDYASRFDLGTPMNDVFTDPDEDFIVFNPLFHSIFGAGETRKFTAPPILMDMLQPNPDVNTRIEVGVYKWGSFLADGVLNILDNANTNISGKCQIFDLSLPDHYVVMPFIFTAIDCTYSSTDSMQLVDLLMSPISGPTGNVYNKDWYAYLQSKFQWAPVSFMDRHTAASGYIERWNPYGELNYYTLLDNKWFVNVNDAKYFGLFQIK